MAKVGDVISIAAKHLGLSAQGQAASGADHLVLEAEFNGLMHELSASFALKDEAGAAYTHTDQTTGDTLAIGDRFVTGLGAMVAERTTYLGTGNLRPETRVSAGRGYGLIAGAFQKTVTQDAGLLSRLRTYT